MNKPWQLLYPGDTIQVIAPASKIPAPAKDLDLVKALIERWGLKAKISPLIVGEHDRFASLAHTDEKRFEDLTHALIDPAVKAIWAIRGGYGTIRLLNKLLQFPVPSTPKLLMGFSDVTLLLLCLTQIWQWNTVHGPTALQAATGNIHAHEIALVRQLLFGEINQIVIDDLYPMNPLATQPRKVTSSIIGGNLTVLSRTFGLPGGMQLAINNKILILEEVDEPLRKVDGILQQMQLQGYFKAPSNKPDAVILGEFIANSTAEQTQVNHALAELAEHLAHENIPVMRCANMGHGPSNRPIPFGPAATLHLGIQPTLTIESGADFSGAQNRKTS